MTQPERGAARVVIDSNVAVPILTYPQPDTNWLAMLWQTGRIIPLANQDTLDELEEVLKEHAPTTREYPAQRFVEAALRRYTPWCEIVPPGNNNTNPECDDEDDQKFIDLAFAGNADFLITRDHALLVMDRKTGFTILDDTAFRQQGT